MKLRVASKIRKEYGHDNANEQVDKTRVRISSTASQLRFPVHRVHAQRRCDVDIEPENLIDSQFTV